MPVREGAQERARVCCVPVDRGHVCVCVCEITTVLQRLSSPRRNWENPRSFQCDHTQGAWRCVRARMCVCVRAGLPSVRMCERLFGYSKGARVEKRRELRLHSCRCMVSTVFNQSSSVDACMFHHYSTLYPFSFFTLLYQFWITVKAFPSARLLMCLCFCNKLCVVLPKSKIIKQSVFLKIIHLLDYFLIYRDEYLLSHSNICDLFIKVFKMLKTNGFSACLHNMCEQ